MGHCPTDTLLSNNYFILSDYFNAPWYSEISLFCTQGFGNWPFFEIFNVIVLTVNTEQSDHKF